MINLYLNVFLKNEIFWLIIVLYVIAFYINKKFPIIIYLIYTVFINILIFYKNELIIKNSYVYLSEVIYIYPFAIQFWNKISLISTRLYVIYILFLLLISIISLFMVNTTIYKVLLIITTSMYILACIISTILLGFYLTRTNVSLFLYSIDIGITTSLLAIDFLIFDKINKSF